ncbi:MAG: heme-degrading domain-containing protein [Moraxellaceae bacterium]|nr:heme-degrading domain-containing protein [Moraxellaceae bacterium]
MTLEEEISRVALQEKTLQFERFNTTVAWELGSLLKAKAEARGVAVAIDITLAGAPLFFYAMPGTNPGNADWIRRKRNTVMRFHKSSYLVGIETEKAGTTLEARTGSTPSEYVAVGGSFPIRLLGSGAVIGSVSVSGLPARDDHNLLVIALADYLKADLASIALDH